MLNTFESKIIKTFEFLKKEYDFMGPFKWNLAYEQEYTYVNGRNYLNIGFDGGYFVSVGITNYLIPELSTGQLTLKDIKYEDRKSLELLKLLSKQEKVEYNKIKNPIDELYFWVNIIKNNSEILYGDWYKASLKYKMLKYIHSVFYKRSST